jgi:hypothetical protein
MTTEHKGDSYHDTRNRNTDAARLRTGRRDDAPTPTPGSAAALAAGCTCSKILNCDGTGAFLVDGEPVYYVRSECPVHDPFPQGQGALWEWLMMVVFVVAALLVVFFLLPAWTP